ncbi:LacI family transcriptional regulator [Tatumella morbirosei]|uniref:LacI family transcriptional regulator n=1 Tax=Tatumella morbirosei TaxID=642227 RepID=A0A095TRI3_9GAMM|nr:LacI family DNA-binding transcriptional regulator [Tatumella morbirosei]KGD79476.1 LacI family transcriptional regulator [Tatumella morbirosei]
MTSRPARATISDVAKAAGTGKTSVSRYLNGELNVLSPALKERIEQAIATLNYRPSQMARSLKRGRTRLIGLIIADITNAYSVEIMCGIEAACRDYGFTLLMCNTNNEVSLEQYYIQLLSSYQVEGIIVNAVGMHEEELSRLQQSRLPMTLIDRKIEDFDCDVIGLDNHEASEKVTRHLADNGYNALLFISEPVGSVNTRRERLKTFCQTVATYPEVQGENTEIALHQEAELNHCLDDFLSRNRHQRCAIITANGSLTLQVVKQLQAKGIVCGTDVGLVGFDEMNWSSLVGTGITTLRQPTHQIGYRSLQSVINRIKQAESERTEHFFSGELVIRGSSQPLQSIRRVQ